jgi:hypothetical protein
MQRAYDPRDELNRFGMSFLYVSTSPYWACLAEDGATIKTDNTAAARTDAVTARA